MFHRVRSSQTMPSNAPAVEARDCFARVTALFLSALASSVAGGAADTKAQEPVKFSDFKAGSST